MNNPSQDAPDFSKRYWLFAWNNFIALNLQTMWPMKHFVKSFDTLEEAMRYKPIGEEYPNLSPHWEYQVIYDCRANFHRAWIEKAQWIVEEWTE